MSPSPPVARQWSRHPTSTSLQHPQIMIRVRECFAADFVSPREIDNSRMREHRGLCLDPSSDVSPRSLVTCGHIGGWASHHSHQTRGPPTSRGRHRVIKRSDGLIWGDPRYRGLLCFNEHFTDPALFVINTDTRDSFDAIAEIPLICILNSLNLLSLKWTQNKKSAIKKRLRFYNIQGGLVTRRMTRQGNRNQMEIKWI